MNIEGFDIETAGDEPLYGLQPWRVRQGASRVTMWAVAAEDVRPHVTLVPDDAHAAGAEFKQLCERWCDTGIVVAAWNAPFEVAWLCALPGVRRVARHVRWLDAMLLHMHLTRTPEYETLRTKRRSYSLKAAVAEYIPEWAGYEDGVDLFSSDPLVLGHYNAIDAEATRLLAQKFLQDLRADKAQWRCALLEAQSIYHVGLANLSGMVLDPDAIEALNEKLVAKEAESLAAITEYGATPAILRSPKKLGELMFGTWGLTPLKAGKTGPSTDKEVLYELGLVDERVKQIQSYRESVNLRKKFVVNLAQSLTYNRDGCTHPIARMYGTYSGRMTYESAQGRGRGTRQTGFAIHQMKRAAEFRNQIVAPDGYVYVEFDAASQEFRWMAEVSGDQVMRKLCRVGEDPHAYMASGISGVDYREIQQGAGEDKKLKSIRQLGKVGNLSCQYRTSAEKLLAVARVQYGMDIEIGTAMRIHQTYRETYPGVPRFWKQAGALVMRDLCVRTLAGRKVHIPEEDLRNKWAVQSTAINFPVQGTGADQKYLALAMLSDLLEESGARFSFDLHDGLYFVVPQAWADEFIETGLQILNNLPYTQAWGYTPSVPMPWDAKIGTTWGNMTEVKL